MARRILTICIPTFNRIKITEAEVKEYLVIKDERIGVNVCDNHSSDDTYSRLSKISDERLRVIENPENIGPKPNEIKSLSDNDSEYVILTLDKDKMDPQKLVEFIDLLEEKKPYFGYVNLDIYAKKNVEVTSPGVENVLKVAYLNKHPSGYFYRSDLFNDAIKRESFTKLDKNFDFPYEILNGELATKYPSSIVSGGYVINANYRKELHTKDNSSRSYKASNLWYDANHRLKYYSAYLDNALSLNLSMNDKLIIVKKITADVISNVTYGLRRVMADKEISEHYHVEPRYVSFKEMVSNLGKAISVFKSNASGRLSNKDINRIAFKSYLHFIYIGLKNIIKKILHKK